MYSSLIRQGTLWSNYKFLLANLNCHFTFSWKRYWNWVSTHISFQYLLFLLLNLWFEVWKFIFKLHWTILIDFDWKIKNLLCRIFLYEFQIFWRYRKVSKGVLILKYRYLRLVSKLGIKKYRFLKWVLWSGIEKYRYLNLILKRCIEKYRSLKKVSIPNTT